ncbi:MAG: DUF4143 domain-containing protein [Bacillota bacterium]|nr:DUF4143 domain-containing protein [Bacillota bacterium]
MEYKKRITDEAFDQKLRVFGGVLIIGPKGCGKTTSAKKKAKSIVEFQDEDKRDFYLTTAETVPSRLLIGENPRLFDEWQDAPKIWGAARKSIDDSQKKGLYIFTGSSSSSVETSHTGTLRISTLRMDPMSLYESGESGGEVSLKELFAGKELTPLSSSFAFDDLLQAACRGGWPASLDPSLGKDDSLLVAKDLFYQTCHVDISKIDGVKRNPVTAERILKSYSRNIATLAKSKTIYDDVNNESSISETTFNDYLGALRKLYIIEDVEAWTPAIRSRELMRNTPKRNLVDPSIAVASLGLSPSYFNEDLKTFGFLFESLCLRDLRIYSSSLDGKLSYYHDRYGLEADAVLHLGDGRYALIEFKLGEGQIEEGARHLNEIEALIKKANEREGRIRLRMPDLKVVITGGSIAFKREDGVYVVPITCLKD